MSELEKLQTQAFIARNRIADLEAQLTSAAQQLQEIHERLKLSDHERAVLKGRDDGCVRVGELWPILNRIFGPNGNN